MKPQTYVIALLLLCSIGAVTADNVVVGVATPVPKYTISWAPLPMATCNYSTTFGRTIQGYLHNNWNGTPMCYPFVQRSAPRRVVISSASGDTVVIPPANNTNQTNDTNGTFVPIILNDTPPLSANLSIKDPFPMGSYYVFVCEANLSGNVSYDWDFGDGSHLYQMDAPDIFHTYLDSLNFSAQCVAHNETVSAIGNLNFTVNATQTHPFTHVVYEEIAPRVFDFHCVAGAFAPTEYTWDFGDNTHFISQSPDVEHGYHSNFGQNVMATCTASDSISTVSDTVPVSIAPLNQTA